VEETKKQDEMRIQKLLAERGLCSRRVAEEWIKEGRIWVNGKIAEVGQKVNPNKDRVVVDRKPILPLKIEHLVLAFNKPKGYVCTHHDPHEPRTIFDIIPAPYCKQKLLMAGRLDKDSEGLLILTNDGALVNRLTHPSYNVIKRYQVVLNKAFDPKDVETLLKGVYWEGERLYAKKVILSTEGVDREKRIEIHLGHGRKREIRNMCLALGYQVKKLRRFQIGKYVLRGLREGQLKRLEAKDIKLLMA
jgi:23S rRNA pseudouridine2605 synthase